ncbi:type II toxin-antitoxin system RelE/ParE family toxin [Nocardia sp. NPDC052566]|uniref:type II toxin-antitoxin system RelE/ParE family toxin n=1 Tax=Nocardia sp. NPDC052566 TaxID=3364330 RepID=UPI0037C77B67
MQSRIQFHPTVSQQLQALPHDILREVLTLIVGQASADRPGSARRIVGTSDSWRIRTGIYRVAFTITPHNDTLTVMRVSCRRDAYRD